MEKYIENLEWENEQQNTFFQLVDLYGTIHHDFRTTQKVRFDNI